MTPFALLTPLQADAIRATAAQHLRDPDEMARELLPLLTGRPPVPALEPRTVEMEVTVADPAMRSLIRGDAEPVWSLLGHTEQGFRFYARQVTESGFGVNDGLTLNGMESK
jgi:hypothetical protein